MNLQQKLSLIKTQHKSPLQFGDYLNYILFCLGFGGFIFGGVFFLFQHFAVREDSSALVMGPIFIIAGILFLRFAFIRLRQNNQFEQINLSSNETVESIVEKLKKHFNINKIDIDREAGLIEIKTKTTLMSWGEIITLIFDGSSILVNSRAAGQPITINKDRENIQRLRSIFI